MSKAERQRRHDAKRRAEQPERRWYKTARWQRLRLTTLARDLYTCRGCGLSDLTARRLDVDHIVPHRGDWDRFHDPNNLQALCKTCHAGAKQSEETLGYSDARGEDGWPVDPRHPSNRA